jgi:hypothetical protein
MKPLAPVDIKAYLLSAYRAFGSKTNTILAQFVILTLLMMIIVCEASLQGVAQGMP